jgi:hypothetical protein
MKILCILAVLVATAPPATAKTSNRRLLLSMHRDLDGMCRDIVQSSTNDACRVRTNVTALLHNESVGTGNRQSNEGLALSIYKDLDAMCRGYGGWRLTETACEARNKASALLRNMGYCWRSAWWKKCRS